MSSLTQAEQRILRDMKSRQRRRKSPFFVVEGLRTCLEAITRRPDWIEFTVITESTELPASVSLPSPPRRLSDNDFSSLSATENPQGILVVCRRPEAGPSLIEGDPFLLVLDQVRDPGNVGTILRSAWAVGLKQVIWTAGSADPWSPKTVRSGMGAQFALSPIKVPNAAAALDLAAAHGYERVWQPTPHGGTSCFSPDFDLAGSVLLIGNETEDTRQLTGDRVCIPMPGTAESLNVAQATTLLLFEAVRRQIL